VAEYYARVARWLLPHIALRPVTFVRCPNGWGSGFFQKHAKGGLPAGVRVVKIGKEDVLTLDDDKALIAFAQMCVLEIHIWGAHVTDLDAPDMLVFDLDPDPAVAWATVVETAHAVRARLESQGHRALVKTTGGKGLHVCCPIQPKTMTWKQAHDLGRALGEAMATEQPERYVTNISKAKRKGKILLDFGRNTRGMTFVAPYSPRARAGAPVAMPLRWEELTPDVVPASFTLRSAVERLEAHGDAWAFEP
jgi:bifunctional non-homologous end joining protein LigD